MLITEAIAFFIDIHSAQSVNHVILQSPRQPVPKHIDGHAARHWTENGVPGSGYY